MFLQLKKTFKHTNQKDEFQLKLLYNILQHLQASSCHLKRIADILLCDTHHMDKNESLDCDPAEDFVKAGKHEFVKLEYLNLRGNDIKQIDKGIMLAPKVKTLLLGGNRIKSIENLIELPELAVLELSDNSIDDIENLHAKIGQLTRLDLANN